MKGFTLIEILVYISILSVVATGFISFGSATAEAELRASYLSEADYSAKSAADHIGLRIREASAIVSPAPGATSTQLELVISPLGHTSRIYLQDGYIVESLDGGEAQRLTTDTVLAGGLSFIRVSGASEDDAGIAYQFNIRPAGGQTTGTLEYRSASVLRVISR